MNPLVELHAFGQSFWYDNIRRKFLQDGTLQGLIDNDGLRGMTSNPAIFEKAIGGSDDYDEQMAQLVAAQASTQEIYEKLAITDIQTACDLFAPLYAESNGGDGYVSLEVSPNLARDTEGTIREARTLFAAVGRPNLMIKVPATPEGIASHQATHQRRHQRQCHAHVQHGTLQCRRPSLHRRGGRPGRKRRRPQQSGLRRFLLRQPRRCGR